MRLESVQGTEILDDTTVHSELGAVLVEVGLTDLGLGWSKVALGWGNVGLGGVVVAADEDTAGKPRGVPPEAHPVIASPTEISESVTIGIERRLGRMTASFDGLTGLPGPLRCLRRS
jgi:hypothetical protein